MRSADVLPALKYIVKSPREISLFKAFAPIINIAMLLRTALSTYLKSFQNLAKVNQIFRYVFWELQDIRFGKDIRLYGAEPMTYVLSFSAAISLHDVLRLDIP